MDPITAISLVSGIISFVSFGKDLVKGVIKIHESHDGYSKENQNREFVADEIRRFSAILQPPGESGLAGEDKGLASLAAKCHELAEDMAKVLDKLKAKDPNSKLQSVWAALKATVHEKDLRDFEQRLDQCTTQMHLQLTFFTSRHTEATLNRLVASASSDATALERLKTNVDQLRQSVGTVNKELAKQAGQVMQLLGKAFDTTIQQKVLNSLCFEGMTTRFKMVEEAHLDTFKWMFDASDFVYDAPLESVRSLFGEPALDGDLDDAWDSAWESEDEGNHKAEETDGEIVEDEDEEDNDNDGADGAGLPPTVISTGREVPSAYDSGLTKRSIKVKFTTGKGFIEWLSSSDGIFHISGKMGSGKSTMMRFLYEHPATRYELNRWAGARVLVFANFFFWKPGSSLQKNLTGLLRALLHATLKTCPELIPMVMPECWKKIQAQPWQDQSVIQISNKAIRDALLRLIQNPDIQDRYRFCFFIDGLDEYEGTVQEDQRHMVDFILRWTKASRGNLKLCVSSREQNIFMDAFRADKRIRLHEFTKYDMERYTHDKLKHILDTNTRESLVRGILCRAHGMFLWVSLVVKTVREHAENDATEDELATLISSIPDDLDHLFEHLFLSISRVNSKRAFQVFTLLLSARKHNIRLYLYGLSFLEEYERNNRFAFLETPHTLKKSQREAATTIARTRKQLNNWCRGLVDAVHRPEAYSQQCFAIEYQVDFTHRSLYDFLESSTAMMDNIWQTLLRGFDAVDALTQITWATHKPTLTTCPRKFPVREIIAMRLGNGLDRAPFEYLERLAGSNRRYMSMVKEHSLYPDRHYVTVGVSVACMDHVMYDMVASRRCAASKEPNEGDNFADTTSCSFGILLHAVWEGHFEYLKWKIENDLSSIVNNCDKAVLLICTFLESTVSVQSSHLEAGAAVLALLFETNLASPESMSFWTPGDLARQPFSAALELVNPELSIWHWYLFRVTFCFIGSLSEGPPIQHIGKPSSGFRVTMRLSAQKRPQIGKALETFLEHGADPYFMLSILVTEIFMWGNTVYSFKLDFELGREKLRISMLTADWMRKRPSSFGRFPLNQGLKLTFQQWIQALELPNHDRLRSLLERNKRREDERLVEEAAKERISYHTAASETLESEGDKPSTVGAMDELVKLEKGGPVTRQFHIGGAYTQMSLLALGILIALGVQFLWVWGSLLK